MKYFLVIGIEYKFFQRPANITIHVGNRFIDEFTLEKDFPPATDLLSHVDSKWYEKHGKEHWITRKRYVEKWNQLPALFKVYEIDDSALEGKLEIKVQNDNSDFTNGFMKNSSLIKFPIVALFKKDLVGNRGEKMMKAIVKFCKGWNTCAPIGETDFASYEANKPPGFIRSRWPNASSFWVARENEIHEKSVMGGPAIWLGGSFTAEFVIKTKHHMKTFAPAGGKNEFGFPDWIDLQGLVVATYKKLLNIYDEDQRSDSTKD
tara:strand:- start:56 stop:841 length:786 start_codon:yes stop_codon:yes gene_type:complete